MERIDHRLQQLLDLFIHRQADVWAGYWITLQDNAAWYSSSLQ